MLLRMNSVTRRLAQRSQVIRRNHDGRAWNGWSSASAPEGNGSVP